MLFDLRQVDIDQVKPVLLEEIVHQRAIPRPVAHFEEQGVPGEQSAQLQEVEAVFMPVRKQVGELKDEPSQHASFVHRIEHPVNRDDIRFRRIVRMCESPEELCGKNKILICRDVAQPPPGVESREGGVVKRRIYLDAIEELAVKFKLSEIAPGFLRIEVGVEGMKIPSAHSDVDDMRFSVWSRMLHCLKIRHFCNDVKRKMDNFVVLTSTSFFAKLNGYGAALLIFLRHTHPLGSWQIRANHCI